MTMRMLYLSVLFLSFNILLFGCTSESPLAQQANNNNILVGALMDDVQTDSAWSAANTITENLISEYFGDPVHLAANANDVLFAAWEAHNTGVPSPSNAQIQFAIRPGFDTPWQLTSPDLTDFSANILLAPRLHSDPDSNTVYATWYSPDHGLNTHYISRYQASTGWSEPVAFSDSEYSAYKILFESSGKALLLWVTYAENHSAELHARLFNEDGRLSLMNTLLLDMANQPGLFITKDYIHFDGWVTETGEVEVYWAMSQTNFENSMEAQLWKSRLSITEAGLSDWSPSQIIENGFLPSKALKALHVFNHGPGNTLVVFHAHDRFANDSSIFSLESSEDNWGSLTAIDETSPAMIEAAIAGNRSGQVAVVWTDIDPELTTGAIRVFAKQYDAQSGWLPTVQISASSPASPGVVIEEAVLGRGDAPKVDINSAGQVAVMWVKPIDETQNFYANHFDPNNGWSDEELAFATKLAADRVNNYSIVINASAKASIVWQQTETRPQGVIQQVKFVDHVGRGNGVVNTAISISVPQEFSDQIALIGPQNAFLNRRATKRPLTLLQRTERLLTVSEAPPIRIKSPWNVPVMVDTVISEAFNQHRISNPLHILMNDEGHGVINFVSLPGLKSADVSGEVNTHVWAGDVLTGEWSSNPPRLNADPGSIYIDDVELDSTNSDIYMAWRETCIVETVFSPCPALYVSRKSGLENWQAQRLVGESSIGGINLVTNSSGTIGSVWKVSQEVNASPGIAYAEFIEGSGWQTPDVFYPPITPAEIKLQSHGNSQSLLTLSDNNTLSLLEKYDSTSDLTLLQYHPSNGWTEEMMLSTSLPMNYYQPYLNASGVDSGIHLVFMAGGATTNTILQSVQYRDGAWHPFVDINTPSLGDIWPNYDSILAAGNKAGVMLVAWSEKIRSGPDIVDQIRLSWYYPATGWTPPTDIGLPIRSRANKAPGMPEVPLLAFLNVSINDANQGGIAWVDNSSIQRKLNFVHLDPVKTVLNNELVASLNGRVSYFGAVDVHIDSQARVVLVWDEITPQSTHDGHRIVTMVHHSEGVISSPDHPLPYLPSVSPNWSEPQIVREIALVSEQAQKKFIHRSSLEMNTPTPLLSIQVDSQFYTNGDIVSSTEHLLSSSDVVGAWKNETPFETFPTTSQSTVTVVSDPVSGRAFIAWLSKQALYLNVRSTDGNWGTPQAIASDIGEFYLLSNSKGQVAMLWQNTSDRSTVFMSEISVDSTGLMQLAPASPSIVSDTEMHGEPVFNHNGTLGVLRRSLSTPQSQALILTQYVWQSGWQAVSNDPLEASDFNLKSIKLAVTSDTQANNDQVVVLAQSKLNRKLHSRFLLPDGTWTNWMGLDANDNQDTALMGEYRVGTSASGQLYVLWVDESINKQNQPHHSVLFTRFEAAGLAAGKPWLVPEVISEIRHPNFHETPRLLVGNDGSAAVVWKHPVTPLADAILIRKFQLASGWQQEPEIVAAFPVSIKQNIKHINAGLSERGVIVVTWQTLQGSSELMQAISMSESQMLNITPEFAK